MTEHAEKPSRIPHSPNSEEPIDFDINIPDRPVPSEDDEDVEEE
jgi:hypothetical protein